LKILVLCYEYPPVGGGGGRIAAGVAAELAARGHQVKYLTGNVNPPHQLPESETRDGVEILRTASPRRLPDTCTVPEMGYYVAWAIPAGWRIIKKFRPDVLHAHFAVPTGAAAWALSVLTGIPYVLTAHLGDVPGGVPEQTDRMFRWIKPFTTPIWRRAAGITAVSSFVAQLAREAYGREAVIIPNGLPRIPGQPEKPGPCSEPVRLLFVGRMSVQKNLRLALEALALVRDMPWCATLVGDGPLRPEAEEFVVSAALSDRVKFTGWLSPGELARARQESAILLMPSLSEGLPMAAVEALADGLAIVGTNIPGLADVVEPESNGLLCEATPEAFAAGVRRILQSGEMLGRFRLESRKMAGRFDFNRIVNRYEEVLAKAGKLAGNPAAKV